MAGTLVACLLPLTGCLGLGPDDVEAVILQPPNPGDVAVYTAHPWTFVNITVLQDADVLGVNRDVVPARAAHFVLARDFGQGLRYSSFAEWLAQDGRRAMVSSTCTTLGWGFVPESPPCQDSGRLTASRADFGLPGLFGAAGLWGKRLLPGIVSLDYSFMGAPAKVDYQAKPSTRAGAQPCLSLEAAGPVTLNLTGQAYTPFSGLPTSLEVCSHSRFPFRVAFEAVVLELLEASAPSEPRPIASSPDLIDPWRAAAAADAIASPDGLPPTDSDGPAGLAVEEAVKHFLTQDDRGAAFAELNGPLTLRRSLVERFQHSSGNDSESYSKVERTIEMEGAGGRTALAVIHKECQTDICELWVDAYREETRPPSAAPPDGLLSRPFHALAYDAQSRLGSEFRIYSVATYLPGPPGTAYSSADSYIYNFYAPSHVGGVGVPLSWQALGGSGEWISFSLPAAVGSEILGLHHAASAISPT